MGCGPATGPEAAFLQGPLPGAGERDLRAKAALTHCPPERGPPLAGVVGDDAARQSHGQGEASAFDGKAILYSTTVPKREGLAWSGCSESACASGGATAAFLHGTSCRIKPS